MITLPEYHQKVRDAILQRTGEPLLNGTVEHATFITQEAFSSAQSKIQILSSRLDVACYAQPNVINAAKAFLADPDHELKILIEAELWDSNKNFDWSKHPLVAALKDYWAGLKIRLVPKESTERYKFNFLLLDDFGYRFEADRLRAAAVAAFFPPGSIAPQVKNLSGVFESLWAASEPYELFQ